MTPVSVDNLERFLGGMFAYIGFQALVWTAYLLVGFDHTDFVTILVSAFPGLGLFIGVAMLVGRERVIPWAIAFLAGNLGLSLWGVMAASVASGAGLPERGHLVLMGIVNLVAPVVLLSLVLWCRSLRLRGKANA